MTFLWIGLAFVIGYIIGRRKSKPKKPKEVDKIYDTNLWLEIVNSKK